MNVMVITAGLIAVFVFPLVTYGVMWFTSRSRETERPDPPETNRPRRTIPGGGSGE